MTCEAAKLLHKYPAFAPVLTLLENDLEIWPLRTWPPDILHFVMENFPHAAMKFVSKMNVVQKDDLGWNAMNLAALYGRLDWIQEFLRLGASALLEDAWGAILREHLHVLAWFLQRNTTELSIVLQKGTWDYEGIRSIPRFARLVERDNVATIRLLLQYCPAARDLFVTPVALCRARSAEMTHLLQPTSAQLNDALQQCFQEGSFVNQMTTLIRPGAVFQDKNSPHAKLIEDCCLHANELGSRTRYHDVLRLLEESETTAQCLSWPLSHCVVQLIKSDVKFVTRSLPPFFRIYLAYWISLVLLLRQSLPSVLAKHILEWGRDDDWRTEFWNF